MKSTTNTTEYDDKLFYQVITESCKKIFICPAKGHFKLEQPEKDNTKNDGIQQFIFIQDKVDQVVNMAAGKITQVTKEGNRSQVVIEHDNGITSWYMADFVYGVPAVGVELRQGDIIGHCKEFYLAIMISPKIIFTGKQDE